MQLELGHHLSWHKCRAIWNRQLPQRVTRGQLQDIKGMFAFMARNLREHEVVPGTPFGLGVKHFMYDIL